MTFKNVETEIIEIENKLYNSILDSSQNPSIRLFDLKKRLTNIRETIIRDHKSLFLEQLDDLIFKVNIFGYHFATLDIRQDSRIHNKAFSEIIKLLINNRYLNEDPFYEEMDVNQKLNFLSKLKGDLNPNDIKNTILKSTLESIRSIKTIQKSNGEKGSNRYIISNNQSAVNIMEVFAMFRLSDWSNPTVDIVPLFETVSDLENAKSVMKAVYQNKNYRNHLSKRNNEQTIMLGFSDGTKDGGYLMANWSILKAKESLTTISRKFGVKVIFFDGRGGPPARGGGNTNKFYASLGDFVESDQIQMTVQGQTISSNFGTIDSCQYNLEQLLSAGIQNRVLNYKDNNTTIYEKKLLSKLAQISYDAYSEFKNHPKFIPYLENMTTIKYYSRTNIGSRPSKRANSNNKFDFSSLRAIPFVGSWSQLKQNVPGFYGVGTALNFFYQQNNFSEIKKLYQNSLFLEL